MRGGRLHRTLILLLAALQWVRCARAYIDYTGGAALRVPDDSECPADTVACERGLQQTCCPGNQVCVYDDHGTTCCEQGTQCNGTVVDEPKCADSSWSYCSTATASLGFCCEETFSCFFQSAVRGNGGGVGCASPSASLASGQSAVSTVYAANDGPGASTATTAATTTATTASVRSSSTTAADSSGTSAAGVSSSPSASSSSAATGSAPALSAGGIAGVTVAGVVVAAGLLAAGRWCRACRRKEKPRAATPVAELAAPTLAELESQTGKHGGVVSSWSGVSG